jgi:hypothetical protein
MKPIDQPFRFTWDFCVVWALLVLPTFLLYRQWKTDDAAWARYATVALLSLFATFSIYGPVLLVRQIIRSGSRGWFVVRVALTIVLAIAIFFFSFKILGHGRDIPFLWIFITSGVAGAYLHWRIDK